MKVAMMQVGPIQTNCYLLMDEESKTAAIVDPGEDGHRILSVLAEEGYTPTHILLTHGHYDHTTAVPTLKESNPNLQVYIHQADAGGGGDHLFPLADQLDDLLLYNEGDTVQVGSLTINVLSTPGHSKGSVVLQVEDVLFTGDTLFARECGRCDLKGGSFDEILSSLYRLSQLEGNFAVLPGHDRTSDLASERKMNPYMLQGIAKYGNK